MTKEELKQEAEAFVSEKWTPYDFYAAECNVYNDDIKEDLIKAYLAGAEPREKRIVELQHLIKTQDRKLRQQSKVCDNAIARVETLFKENAELKKELRDKKCNNKDCPVFIKLVQENKETTDLRARLHAINILASELEKQSNATRQQLTKAKELIRTLLLVADNKISQMEFQLCVADAKQFLEESK